MEKKGLIIAEGEATGHAHRAVGGNLSFKDQVLSADEPFTFVHEEHSHILLAPMDYDISSVVEFDHWAEEARRVED